MKEKTRYVAYVALTVLAVGVLFSAVSGAQVDGTPAPQSGDGGEESNATTEELEQVTGTLEEAESGERDYMLGEKKLEIGPRWYVEENEATADFDGDGTVETIAKEFDGMVGQEVTLTVESEGDGDTEEIDVHAVDGVSYRGDGPPPWAGGPDKNRKTERGGMGQGPPPWAGGPDGDGGDTEDSEEVDERDDRNGGNGPPPWAGGPDKDRKGDRKGGGPPPWAGGPNR